VRSLIREMLEARGYVVIEASDAETAIAFVASDAGAIDLLVTDIVLPGLSGPRLFEHLTRARPGLRALFMSGYSDDLIEQRATVERNLAYLQKPFSAAALTQRVREILDGEPSALA